MSTVPVSLPAQQALLYHNTDNKAKRNIWKKKCRMWQKYNKPLKSKSFLLPLLMDAVIRCLYLGLS